MISSPLLFDLLGLKFLLEELVLPVLGLLHAVLQLDHLIVVLIDEGVHHLVRAP